MLKFLIGLLFVKFLQIGKKLQLNNLRSSREVVNESIDVAIDASLRSGLHGPHYLLSIYIERTIIQ
jgi:hypothetical protein